MARRGPRRRDPLEEPSWFKVLWLVAWAVALFIAPWVLGFGAHGAWQWLLAGWQASP